MKKLLLISATVLTLMTAPAHAQWIVFDPSNYAQNILTGFARLNGHAVGIVAKTSCLTSVPFDELVLKILKRGGLVA